MSCRIEGAQARVYVRKLENRCCSVASTTFMHLRVCHTEWDRE